jgi:hypothetical protein
VVFDLGEVLATPPDLYGVLAARLKRPAEAVESVVPSASITISTGCSAL